MLPPYLDTAGMRRGVGEPWVSMVIESTVQLPCQHWPDEPPPLLECSPGPTAVFMNGRELFIHS